MFRNKMTKALFIFVGLATMTGPLQALAGDSGGNLLDDNFTASLGTFLLDTKTTVSLDGSAGDAGTVVDMKRDLGLKDTDRFRVDATWRFAKRHKIRMMYFDTSRSKTATLDRDITVGDTVYPVDGDVTADNSTTVAELAYEYVFLSRDNYEVAGSAGVHSIRFKFAISGDGSVNGVPGTFSRESGDTTAPLPVIGLRGLWQLSPNWYLDAQGQYFQLKYDAYDGSVTDLRIGVTRMFGEHFGLGAGYNRFTTKLGVSKDSFDGQLRWDYSGAQVFVTASF